MKVNVASLFVFAVQFAHICCTQFASHVSVNTPARSFTHGVGDPLPSRRAYQGSRNLRRPPVRHRQRSGGYPRIQPSIPFTDEEVRGTGINSLPFQYDSNMETSIPVLPLSPYKVDSPDPESLWPEGLFLPPVNPARFRSFGRRTDSTPETVDPYLLEGSEAIAAVSRAQHHGLYYFHDIPHIASLLTNQELRVANHLEPHRIASIRHTWPYNRP
ncbi:uncharacterized protein [Choristoneura fumiferana]|uniref:uncharacterized protein n=1 Tax=Choristoneura fumiferana TaxID=7141 RepID=UPI003D154CFB